MQARAQCTGDCAGSGRFLGLQSCSCSGQSVLGLNPISTITCCMALNKLLPSPSGFLPWNMGMLCVKTDSPEKVQDSQNSWGKGNGVQVQVAKGHK